MHLRPTRYNRLGTARVKIPPSHTDLHPESEPKWIGSRHHLQMQSWRDKSMASQRGRYQFGRLKSFAWISISKEVIGRRRINPVSLEAKLIICYDEFVDAVLLQLLSFMIISVPSMLTKSPVAILEIGSPSITQIIGILAIMAPCTWTTSGFIFMIPAGATLLFAQRHKRRQSPEEPFPKG